MALVRPDPPVLDVQREALLVVVPDDLLQHLPGEWHAGRACPRQQILDVGPTLAVEQQTDALGVVAQHEAEELAEPDLRERGAGPVAV